MDKGFACPQSVLSRWKSEDKFNPGKCVGVCLPFGLVPGAMHCRHLQRGKDSRTPTAYRRPGMAHAGHTYSQQRGISRASWQAFTDQD